MIQLNNFLIRRAQPEDKPTVVAFCQFSFENEVDYIPDVWDFWLTDCAGQVLVAVLNGLPVGMSRVLRLSQHEGWWEGLRVDRAYRQQGIGHLLFEATVAEARSLGIETLRTCISVKNSVMQRYVNRQGFTPREEYAVYKAQAIAECSRQLQPLDQSAIETVWAGIGAFEVQSPVPLVVRRGAKWQALTQKFLATRLEKGWVWGDICDRSVRSLFIRSEMENPTGNLWIGWLGASAKALPVALEDMRRLAYQGGFEAVGGFLPQTLVLKQALEKGNYCFSDTAAYCVYEKLLSEEGQHRIVVTD